MATIALEDSRVRGRANTRARGPLLVLLLVFALAVSGFVYRRNFWNAGSAALAPKITAVSPQLRKLSATVTATGTLRVPSGAEVRVGAQISGIVTKLHVKVGSHIRRGDAIAEIDSRGLNARIEQAKSQILIDSAALEKVERGLARSRALLKEALIARQQTEELEEDEKSAQARLAKSRSDLAVVESDLPYLHVRAPISGTVSSVLTQEGETVAASFSAPNFVTLIEDQALELIAMVDETDIANVRRGDPVAFTTETYPSREFEGTVERVAPTGTIISGVVNYEVAVAIRAGIASLKPNMTANVSIQTAKREALMIPAEAVHKEGAGRFVYIEKSAFPGEGFAGKTRDRHRPARRVMD